MNISRRQFVHRSSIGMAAGLVGARAWAQPIHTSRDRLVAIDGHAVRGALADAPAVRALVQRAVDAARSAGAAYAEARATRTVTETIVAKEPVRNVMMFDTEQYAIGVRALVNGRWGFAASPVWTADEAAQLGRDAAAQAAINATAGHRAVDLGHYATATGTWTMPVRIDPFTISPEEKIDFIQSWVEAANRLGSQFAFVHGSGVRIARQERTMASSEGALTSQTVYSGLGSFALVVRPESASDQVYIGPNGLEKAGAGWEMFLDAKVIDQFPALVELGLERLKTPWKDVDVGRYDAVFDGNAAAAVLSNTIGIATELDRALGYEANATGTSYLGPKPLDLIGAFQAGAPGMTVVADRSMARGLATVKWDDEGVEPEPFTIVKHGILTDYQTTRESAPWLASSYNSAGRPVRSHGCAGAESALSITTQFTPNLSLMPSATSDDVNSLIAGIKKGVMLYGPQVRPDFQARNGFGHGMTREIVNGKLGAFIRNAGFAYGAVDFWRGLQAVGGPREVRVSAMSRPKGQPQQTMEYSVSAPPIRVGNLAIVNARHG